MAKTDHLLKRLPTEMGGLQAGSIQRQEHEYLPWENVVMPSPTCSTFTRSSAPRRSDVGLKASEAKLTAR